MTEAMYDSFAHAFDAHAHRGAFNAFYDRPAVLDLAGDVSGLDVLGGASFDLAVLALVIHHVDNRVAMLRELRRVLRPGGRLVLSTVHPMADWLRLGGDYFECDLVKEEWNDGWPVRFWRQPLGAWCREFSDAGFLIEHLVEPLPHEAMREADPAAFEDLSRTPVFIAFSLLAP